MEYTTTIYVGTAVIALVITVFVMLGTFWVYKSRKRFDQNVNELLTGKDKVIEQMRKKVKK